MKSLEIVKDKLYLIERYPLKMKVEISETEIAIDKEQLEKIEKDLEVLEILQVLILHNGKSVGYKGIIRDFEVMLRLEKITKEQLDKLKQWLEENE